MSAGFERLLAALSDPTRDDGPELPASQQPDPEDPGVWAISRGGPVKAGADLSAARCARWWREHPQGLPEPPAGECGDGYGSRPPARPVDTVQPIGGVL